MILPSELRPAPHGWIVSSIKCSGKTKYHIGRKWIWIPQHNDIQQCRTEKPPRCGRDKTVKVSQQDSKMNRNLCLVILSLAGTSGEVQSSTKGKINVQFQNTKFSVPKDKWRKKEARQGGTCLSCQWEVEVGQSGVQGHPWLPVNSRPTWSSQTTTINWGEDPQNNFKRTCLQTTDLCPKYIKNSYKLIIKKVTQLKNGQNLGRDASSKSMCTRTGNTREERCLVAQGIRSWWDGASSSLWRL